MYVSTLHIDQLIEGLDPERDSALYAIAHTLKDLCGAATESDSRLDDLEQRLTDLEQK